MGYTLNMLSTEYNINVHGIEYLVRLIDKMDSMFLEKIETDIILPNLKKSIEKSVYRWRINYSGSY